MKIEGEPYGALDVTYGISMPWRDTPLEPGNWHAVRADRGCFSLKVLNNRHTVIWDGAASPHNATTIVQCPF